jgi:hypothetical protein
MKICSIQGCNEEHAGRGFCANHYMTEYYYPTNKDKVKAQRKDYVQHNKEKVKELDYKCSRTIKGKWNRFRAECKRDGHLISISYEDFCNFQNEKCHYCGGDLPETGRGLDRKDSSLEYTLNNSISCCWLCNKTKSDKLSYEEMLNLISFRKDNELVNLMYSEC